MKLYNTLDKQIKPPVFMMIYGEGGVGKCHGEGTEILMFDGTIKKVEEIEVGDKLMGDDNKPRNVLSLATGKEMLYEVQDKNGKLYTVNESHILSLWRNVKNKYGVVDIDLIDYLNLTETKKRYYCGYRVPVNYEKKDITIEPYFLGLWLGDGTSESAAITNSNKNIIDYLEFYAKRINLQLSKREDKKHNTYNLAITNGKQGGNTWALQSELRLLNLLKNKHIPQNYLINSKNTRLELLAGLIDTDGYVKNNCIEIVQKSDKLTKDIIYLVRSLGLAISRKEKIVNGVSYNRMVISGNVNIIPSKVHKLKERKQVKNVLHYGIKIKKIGIGTYYGFQIDGNHRYVLGDFSVTHNTTFASTSPNPILADCENGAKYFGLRGIKLDVAQIEKWSDMKDFLELIKKDEYETVIIDPIGELMEKLKQFMIAQGNKKLVQSDGNPTMAGWGWLKDTMRNYLKVLRDCGKNVLLIAHIDEKADEDRLVKRPLIMTKISTDIVNMVDIVGYFTSITKDGEAKRVIYIDPENDKFVAKDRTGMLGQYIESDFSKIIKACQGTETYSWSKVITQKQEKVNTTKEAPKSPSKNENVNNDKDVKEDIKKPENNENMPKTSTSEENTDVVERKKQELQNKLNKWNKK